MKRLFIISAALLLSLKLSAQDKEVFKSPVDTEKKPWTNLNFYNDPDNFQFAIVSDRTGGNRPGIFADAVKKINMLYPEFVLSVGDIIQGYTMDTSLIRLQWHKANELIGQLKMPYFYLPGNHDITNQIMAKEWERRYGKRYYDFVYKNTLFIILDSNDDDDYNLTREQTNYVLETIKKNTGVRWTFVLMHHPIWTYDTDGRFEEIETALRDRDYTVLAGHTHHYHHAERHDRNYYVLSTTGGGNALRGNYFGEMDHISWVTMTDDGPALTNLRLDGILPDDIANETTKQLANALMQNTSLNHIMLCNKGSQFEDGTLYFHFQNKTEYPMQLKINFYHQHQLQIHQPLHQLAIEPGAEKIIPIEIHALTGLNYDQVEALQVDWSLKYDIAEYPDFELSGKYDLRAAPTMTTYIHPRIPEFIDQLSLSVEHPFNNLKTSFELNGIQLQENETGTNPTLEIKETSDVRLIIENEKGQFTARESLHIEKADKIHKSIKVKKPQSGLKYAYYEGNWDTMPDFTRQKPKTTGITTDFWVSDLALRDDHFAVVYKGFFKAEKENMYFFHSRSDDACLVYINDKRVVNQDKTKQNFYDEGSIALKEGFHTVEIHFLEIEGRERFRLYTKGIYENDWETMNFATSFYH